MDFQRLLKFAVENNASDVHIQAGLPPNLRMGGIIHATDQPAITDEQLMAFITEIAPARIRNNVDDRIIAGMDFSYAAPGLSRFRCSAYRNLGSAGITMRVIKSKIP